jgi:hypothetical protein
MNFLNWFRTRPRDEVKREEQAKAAKIASPQPVSAAATTAPASEPAEKRVAAKQDAKPEHTHIWQQTPAGKRCIDCGFEPHLHQPAAKVPYVTATFVNGRPGVVEVQPNGDRVVASGETTRSFLERWTRRRG